MIGRRFPSGAWLRWALAMACLLTTPGHAAEPDFATARDETARLLASLIAIDTTNPPGNELPAARILERFFAQRGIESEILGPASAPLRANLLARLPATAPSRGGPILLLSHLDVVPVDPQAWSFPAFAGAIERGHVYGRGALDDKGQAAVFAKSLALLAQRPGPRHRDLVYLASADEETTAELGVRWMIEHHWERLGPPAVVWNEGGASAPLEILGGRVLNGIATTEKRALWLRLVAEGEGGHGSQPVRGSANDRLVQALARVSTWETPLRVTPTAAETLQRAASLAPFLPGLAFRLADQPLGMWLFGGRLTENRVTNAMLRDTIAVTGLRSGLKANQIPRRAESLIDVRLLPDTDVDGFLARLTQRIADPSVRVELLPDLALAKVPASPWDHELFRALEAELARELPGSVTAPLQTSGSSDSLFFRERGVPAYGYLPAVLGDDLNASVHGLDERIPLDELERAVRVTYRVLRSLVE